jgi:hypothetical protein
MTMQKLHNPIEILKTISLRERLDGERLIRAFRALPKVSSIRLPQGFDDSGDTSSLLLSLTDDDRTKLKLTLPAAMRRPAPPAPPPPTAEPSCKIHVHAILCANDDGSGGASGPNAVDANYIAQLLNTTNVIYQDTGIQIVYDPATDFEQVNSALLNLDFTVPAGLDFSRPESQSPLSDTQIERLSKLHVDERQRIGRQHRHKMVLLFCDGNELIYDQVHKRWTIIPRTFAFSGGDLEYVALPTGKGNLQGFANLVAHETGHYFHQPHPHRDFKFPDNPDKWRLPKDLNEAAALIKDYVENGNNPVGEGLNVFDGDGYLSTPPDAGPDLFQNEYGAGGDCGPNGEINIPVKYSDGSEEEYPLNPDRGNVMSYFKHCLSINMHFSQDQIVSIRESIEEKNRWHLCHPSMRLRNLGAYVVNRSPLYCAVWYPSEESEIQVYDWPQGDLRAKYDELWPQGWRLKLLSPYVVNGEVRYAAVWKPSTEGEIQVYDWPQGDLRAKYDELWPQGWRLKLLSPYVVNGEVRYAAVWKPSTEGEIQVYDWPQGDLRAKYDELWPQGWRLKLLSPYVVNGEVRYAAVFTSTTH